MMFLVARWRNYITAVLLLISAYSGWQVQAWRYEAILMKAKQEQSEQLRAAYLAVNDIATEYEAQQQLTEEKRDVTKREIQTIYRDIVVPGTCVADDRATSLLNRAVNDANTAATGELVVPLSKTPNHP